MNLENIWKVLSMMGLGGAAATASDDAEAAIFGPTGISRVFKPDYVEKMSAIQKLANKLSPRDYGSPRLPNMGNNSINQTMWDKSGNRYFTDNAGTLRRVVDSEINRDEFLRRLREGEKKFLLSDVMAPDSKFAKAYPEQYANSLFDIRSDMPKNVNGMSNYRRASAQNTIELNQSLIDNALADGFGGENRLWNTTEHELQHGIDAYEGLQAGSSDTWFSKLFPAGVGANKTPFDLYESSLGEQMARAAGHHAGWGDDPFQYLANESTRTGSWIPEEARALNPEKAKDVLWAQGQERPWMWGHYGQAFPHPQSQLASYVGRTDEVPFGFQPLGYQPPPPGLLDRAGDAVRTGTQGVKEVAKVAAQDPGLWAGLLPGTVGLGAGFALSPSELGDATLDDPETIWDLIRYNARGGGW